MAKSSQELLQELVTITQDSMKSVESESTKVRGDLQVVDLKIQHIETALLGVGERQTKLEERVATLEKAHAKYLGAALILGAVVSFIMSMIKASIK